jgi:vancomycin resistance protein VanW
MEQQINRSALRRRCGMLYYGCLRRSLWMMKRSSFASAHSDPLPYQYMSHKTVLLRQLKDVDMELQYHKIKNLTLAAKRLNGVLLRPGETFSYWKLIGKPTRRKGYQAGMILRNGTVCSGIGGGLCQMSNLIYWMVLHTPLTVVERHRHGYDVFPDSNRTLPFGSGATCFYPHGDLMIRNDTDETFQLLVTVGDEYLEGEWRSQTAPEFQYEICERNHEMKGEYWGGFSRHNELYRRIFDREGNFLREEFIISNSAMMMYSPFLAAPEDHSSYES